MNFSERKEKSSVSQERPATKMWRRIACAALCAVLLASNLTIAFATETTDSTEETMASTGETMAPIEETTIPSEETTAPSEETTAPSEETTAPSDETTAPSEETTTPSEETTVSTEETTVPNEETTVPSEETTVPSEETSVPTVETEPETPEEPVIYKLYLTHSFRYAEGGRADGVDAWEIRELTDADFVDGVCDISRFALGAEQVTVTGAEPVRQESFEDVEDYGLMGFGQIDYCIQDGWKMVRREGASGSDMTTFSIFEGGSLGDYEFVPANVVTLRLSYHFSNTGGLAGIDAASPETVEVTLEHSEKDDTYKVTWDLPTVTGFRIVLAPAALNQYLVSPPTGKETPEELKAMLENGDFNVDIDKHQIYYSQEVPGIEEHPDYENRYSTDYNRAWNAARQFKVDGETGYSVCAVCGSADSAAHPMGEDHGANALVNPKLEVTLTEAQLANARENGLDITVYYRRNATWYTVNHWMPELLATPDKAVTDQNGHPVMSEDQKYVLQDKQTLQGRVGAATAARAMTSDAYALVSPVTIIQKLIENETTVVDVYYQAAGSYRVIFDTDYTYIPRQQVALGADVDFTKVAEPRRAGYTFDGWRYLIKDAAPDENGKYADDQYIDVHKEDGQYKLTVDEALIKRVKLQENGDAMALHLYPKWTPNMTEVRVILWTEDLTGVDDVQAVATGGNPAYYIDKYAGYGKAPVTHAHVQGTSNSNYSNVGSFTMDVETDLSLLNPDNKTLLTPIQEQVTAKFKDAMGKISGIDVDNFYTQKNFEIVHEEAEGTNYLATKASADGKTMIYVYFTRNIYELQFTYYGEESGNSYAVATNTNGYSWGGIHEPDKVFPGGNLNFGYRGTGSDDTRNNKWLYTTATSDVDMPVPKTITIKAKYGADLRNVWPVARGDEQIGGARMISWATTQGKYCEDGQFGTTAGSTHDGEPTIMGVYAAMGAEIVADPKNTSAVHHLVAYWWKNTPSYYRYNHCYEVPGLNVNDTGVQRVNIHNNDTENVKNVLYLVPTDNVTIAKYNFNDLMLVSNQNGQITYDDANGTFYAVREYNGSYYAVARQVIAVSTNTIAKQNPSARLHMTRVNDKADHSTQYADGAGGSGGNAIGTEAAPYDLYFYYNRDRYTITYMVPSNAENAAQTEYTLGTVTLPYGALVTKDTYGFKLDYQDNNQTQVDGRNKYPWTPTGAPVNVCPDRHANGTAQWTFKGWGLGPAGLNMQWVENKNTQAEAQNGDAFPISANLRLYAIWETPQYKVTFHLNEGAIGHSTADIVEEVPANTRYTATEAAIPRPLRAGYTLIGWYNANNEGKMVDSSGQVVTDVQAAEPFDFDQPVASDLHAVAVWQPISAEKFHYNVYHVTAALKEGDTEAGKKSIVISGDGIVPDGTYYVLEKEEHKDEPFIKDGTLNLTSKLIDGYVPQVTNRALVMKTADATYNVFFHYTPEKSYQHTVRFVLAGTEGTAQPTVVREEPVNADQTVVTPKSVQAEELNKLEYCLVVKDGTGYKVVTDSKDMRWYNGNEEKGMETLVGDAIPDTITYLVQPIPYTVAYENAEGSPAAAEAALAAVTAGPNTPVASANGKNPTQYTTKDTFTAKNPASVLDNNKWYRFSKWTLKNTTDKDLATEFTTLTVDPGSVGNLTFVANWEEIPVYRLFISKTVAGSAGETDKDFHFTVTLKDADGRDISGDFSDRIFTLKHGETKVITGIPVGTSYTVVEAEANQNGYTTTATGATGTIKNQDTTAAFTNTRDTIPTDPVVKTGSLSVSKTVTGLKGDKTKDFTFLVILGDDGINGEYGDMTFVGGRAEFTLRHGERKTARDLPAGVSYSVREEDNEGYSVRKTGDTGVIQEGKTVYARFTNRKTNLDNQPRTGDETKLELWAGMTVLCFLGAAASLMASRKRKGRYSK